ncbi:MAG: hypothetical protein LBH87_04070 [Coriobacteriales bacterium]|jgi:hypothetical protein|nr:hypothetical protein [Coriobacteriales bacterium]
MLQNDYLMRQILLLVEAIRKSLMEQKADPRGDAEMVEASLAQAMDLDPAFLESLAPESLVTILQLGGFDEQLAPYVTRSLGLAAYYRREFGDEKGAKLRIQQLDALAKAYAVDVTYEDCLPAPFEDFLNPDEEEDPAITGWPEDETSSN